MSAFDIAGAIVWTPICIWWWRDYLTGRVAKEDKGCAAILVLGITFASIYCLARCFGASA